ncbi:hypothetical protein ACH6YE_04885, partial [Klebsiella pneumoniae]|nr:hypothetical protein [Klebsiella pneumoniae]MCL3359627.1 hypothetical protein [Klebsiella pneumoniae]MCL3489973.1 hypothetical protein [Klebsiella pneumoniae]MCL3651835.1 hypothetical protein [Klebsiella pneumoniae]
VFAGKKSAQIREILINESAWEEMTCLFALSLIVLPEVWLMLPMATGFIFWIIMQAKNTGGIVIFRR